MDVAAGAAADRKSLCLRVQCAGAPQAERTFEEVGAVSRLGTHYLATRKATSTT